jgi:hypothetical protein
LITRPVYSKPGAEKLSSFLLTIDRMTIRR